MPACTYITLQEAQIATHQKWSLRAIGPEYLSYIQRVPRGQAGKLSVAKDELVSPTLVRNRLAAVARACSIPLTIKRSGQDVYFWREEETASTR